MTKNSAKHSPLKKLWYFIWEDDSLASWLLNVVLAFVIIKYLFLPGLGFMLGTQAPIVAVVSGSMEHDGNFDSFWNDPICCNSACSHKEAQGKFYENMNISKEVFRDFSFVNGFNQGDIMILYSSKKAKVGDVVVYITPQRTDPIIHRVVDMQVEDNKKYFWTKGDHNCKIGSFEQKISEEHVIGKAVWRVPFLGWVKILAVNMVNTLVR